MTHFEKVDGVVAMKLGINNNAGKLFEFKVRETTVNWNGDWKAGSSSWPAVKNEYQVIWE